MVLGIVQDDNTGTGISKTVLFDVPSKTQVWRVLLWWWSLWSWMWFLSLLAQCLVYGVWYATLRERSGSIHHSWASISALCLCGAESSLNHWPFAPGLDRCPRSKSLAVYFGHLPPTVVNQHDLCRYYRRCWTMCVCVCSSHEAGHYTCRDIPLNHTLQSVEHKDNLCFPQSTSHEKKKKISQLNGF